MLLRELITCHVDCIMIRAYMPSFFQVQGQLAVTETFWCESPRSHKSWTLRITTTIRSVKVEIGIVQNNEDLNGSTADASSYGAVKSIEQWRGWTLLSKHRSSRIFE